MPLQQYMAEGTGDKQVPVAYIHMEDNIDDDIAQVVEVASLDGHNSALAAYPSQVCSLLTQLGRQEDHLEKKQGHPFAEGPLMDNSFFLAEEVECYSSALLGTDPGSAAVI